MEKLPAHEKARRTLIERYPEYAKLFNDKKSYLAFAKFMDYLDKKYKDLAYDSIQAMAILNITRFKIDQELIMKNYDLFSSAHSFTKSDEENLVDLKMVRGQILRGEVNAEYRNLRFSGGRWRDERGRFAKGPRF